APLPNRTRGASTVQRLLSELAPLHHQQGIALDLEQLAVRTLEVERVLDPVRAEVRDAAAVQLAPDAVELLPGHRDRDVVHPTDRLPRGGHRVVGKVEEGEQVAVAEVVEEMSGAGQVAVLEQLHQREAEDLA